MVATRKPVDRLLWSIVAPVSCAQTCRHYWNPCNVGATSCVLALKFAMACKSMASAACSVAGAYGACLLSCSCLQVTGKIFVCCVLDLLYSDVRDGRPVRRKRQENRTSGGGRRLRRACSCECQHCESIRVKLQCQPCFVFLRSPSLFPARVIRDCVRGGAIGQMYNHQKTYFSLVDQAYPQQRSYEPVRSYIATEQC